MRYKLTLNNLQISDTLNKDGRLIQTPEPSEVDQMENDLNSMYDMRNWLLWASKNNKFNNKRRMLWLNVLMRCLWLANISVLFVKTSELLNVQEQLFCSKQPDPQRWGSALVASNLPTNVGEQVVCYNHS